MSVIDYKSLGARIKYYRKLKGITQQQLSELIDVVPSNVSNVERGANHISLPNLVKVANALEVSVDQLLCESLEVSNYDLKQDIAEILEDCTDKEIVILTNILRVVKENLKSK